MGDIVQHPSSVASAPPAAIPTLTPRYQRQLEASLAVDKLAWFIVRTDESLGRLPADSAALYEQIPSDTRRGARARAAIAMNVVDEIKLAVERDRAARRLVDAGLIADLLTAQRIVALVATSTLDGLCEVGR